MSSRRSAGPVGRTKNDRATECSTQRHAFGVLLSTVAHVRLSIRRAAERRTAAERRRWCSGTTGVSTPSTRVSTQVLRYYRSASHSAQCSGLIGLAMRCTSGVLSTTAVRHSGA
jgi:hypothetical protein